MLLLPCSQCSMLSWLVDASNGQRRRRHRCPPCETKRREEKARRKQEARSTPEAKAKAAEYWAAYWERNAEALRQKRFEHYHSTKEAKRETMAAWGRAYRDRNKAAISARRAANYQENGAAREKNIARASAWYYKNKDAVLKKQAAYYEQNSHRIKERVREYERAHPEQTKMHGRIKANRRRARLLTSGTHYTRQDVERLLVLQRHKCAYCAASLKRGFHIDHRVPVAKGGDNSPQNIDLLCKRCNLTKSAKLPHEFAQKLGKLL